LIDVTDKFKLKLQNPEGKSEAQTKGGINYYNRVRNTNKKN